jgi:uncharacterized Rmd1/YagE family protein
MTHARIELTDNQAMPAGAAVPRQTARALRLGGRLNLAEFNTEDISRFEAIARSPLALRLESGGVVALFGYGTVVFIGASAAEEEAILQKLADRIEDPIGTAVSMVAEIEIGAGTKVVGDRITVRDTSQSSLIAIADALAKNVALAFEEEEVRNLLKALEPFAGNLADSGRLPMNRRRMLRTVGQAFRAHRRLLERVEVEERPELAPDHGEPGHLSERLAEAYHLKKRARSVSNKLDVIEVMTGGLTELINAQRENRVELLIVLLIAIEIAIWIYESFIRG